MIYIDTHIAVWLYAGLVEKFSEQATTLINEHEVVISEIVRLELQYLYEIQRISDEPDAIISDLTHRIGLNVCNKPFNMIIGKAIEITWTRDPFDRIITANAALNDNTLITKDQNILKHFSHAKF